MNLVNLLNNYISPEFISSTASSFGESETTTSKGLETSLSCILGGILNSIEEHTQYDKVWDLINHQENNSNLLSDPKKIFDVGESHTNSESLGDNLFMLLFSPNHLELQSILGKYAGYVHSDSANKTFSIAASLILSFLKKKVKTEGFGASGLSMWINSSRLEIFNSLPSELNSIKNNSLNKKMKTNNLIENSELETNGSNWWPWLIGLLSLLAFMWFGMKSCNNPKIVDNRLKIETTISDTTNLTTTTDSLKLVQAEEMSKMYIGLDSTVRNKWISLGNIIKLNLPNGNTLSIPENGVEGKLIKWISDTNLMVDKNTWFDFDRILFESGSAKLNSASKEQIQNIAGILKAFPKVNIKIGGYTDNIGNALTNKKLSQNRADALMKELISMGIDSKRLLAEGYGQDHPVADNSKPEGREINRRVSIRVTLK
ncbi:MAG: OmpA family protein [Saprospiraceae bacterium]